MTIPTAIDPGPPPPAPVTAPRRSDRFFSWVAGLGVARSEGWIGGVCAGIADRLRIDPLIVRGIFVVATLFGLPMLFLYALAWALLPDADGRIHARDLNHGRFSSAQVGILAVAIVGLIPVIAAVLIGMPALYPLLGYSGGWSVLATLALLIGLVLVGGLLFLIVRAARRTPGVATELRTASADSATPAESAPLVDSGVDEGADGWGTDAGESADAADPASDPAPEPVLAAEATATDIELWRAQHAAWKEQDQAWRRSQQDAERAARDQARRERQAAAGQFAIEAAERRRVRRASNPRASAAFVAAVVGLALVVGAAVLLGAGTGDEFAAATGLFAAALVLAAGMIVAGISRRRSGFLAFVTVLVLAGGAVATGVPALRDVTVGSTAVSNVYGPMDIRQPFGSLHISLSVHRGDERPIIVDKGTGYTNIEVRPGVELDLRATVGDVRVTWIRMVPVTGEILDSGTWDGTPGPDGTRVIDEVVASERTETVTTQPVTIDQRSGEIFVYISERRSGATS